MRTKPATRWNDAKEHASYGIVNWFNNRNIYDEEIIKRSDVYLLLKKWI